jgi:hypothetical protein
MISADVEAYLDEPVLVLKLQILSIFEIEQAEDEIILKVNETILNDSNKLLEYYKVKEGDLITASFNSDLIPDYLLQSIGNFIYIHNHLNNLKI